MFAFMKKMFCQCDTSHPDDKERERLERRLKAAHEQDKQVRESLSEQQIDKQVKDTMVASDPVSKY